MKKRIKRIKGLNILLITGIILLLIGFIPLPYYVTKPGLAQPLSPYVKVEGAISQPGDFMLTTVAMSKANIYTYLETYMNPIYHLYKTSDIKLNGESEKDYEFRQKLYMEESKQAAILNAYKKAGKPFQYNQNGVLVISVIKDMPAYQKLKLGDVITKVNQSKIQTVKDFTNKITKGKPGTRFTLEVKRKNHTFIENIKTKAFKENPKRSGIGVSIVNNVKLTTQPNVTINSEEIGGPSGGLMFTLETYDQLIDENLAKGYEIAGTGTIDEEGNVGPIGGISQKIVAASDAGAKLFFAPAEKGRKNSNYNEAVKTAKKYKIKMKIVPVNTFDDALSYLEKMK